MASKVTVSIQCSEFLLQRSLNTIEYSEKKKNLVAISINNFETGINF